MWVRDDGVGIDDEVIRDKPPAGTSACRGMREGAEAVGGRLEVRSKAGEVTVVDLNIPAAAAYAAPRLGDVAPAGVATRTDDILKL